MNLLILKDWQALLLAFSVSMLTAWYFLPKVITIASKRKLTDSPGRHKIHKWEVPTLGGVAIFGGFSFGFLLSESGFMDGAAYFVAALMTLFFIGLKDDLITVRPRKKIVVQVIAGIILCIFTHLRFTTFHGFLGITGVPVWLSFFVTIFLIVIIINSFNLIDGIDGLAASIGIVASTAFGLWFWLSKDTGYAIMAASLAGALIVFLQFNISNGKNKIFMGDTGSMVIGFILTVMAIRFNELNAGPQAFRHLNSSPAVAISVLVVPLFDSLRVIIIRLIRGQSPLKADNRHIHHLLLRAGCSHKRSTLYISLANVFLIAAGYLLDPVGILWDCLVLLIFCTILTIPVYVLVARRERWDWGKNRLLVLLTGERKEVPANIDDFLPREEVLAESEEEVLV